MRNLSQTGACLQIACPAGISEAFDLRIDSEGLTHHCKVEWRRASDRRGIHTGGPAKGKSVRSLDRLTIYWGDRRLPGVMSAGVPSARTPELPVNLVISQFDLG
jgi:hypothetical protein